MATVTMDASYLLSILILMNIIQHTFLCDDNVKLILWLSLKLISIGMNCSSLVQPALQHW